tara:strand:+ start:1040 stop:1399 length:360 start_codon:yes stop_codon:yes gene_type:complete
MYVNNLGVIKMALVRVAGEGFAHGVSFSTAQVTGIEIDAGVDLSAKDALGGALESIVQEFSPLLYISTGTAGKIFAIVDGVNVDAASMTKRLQAKGTVDGVDLSAQTVVIRDLASFSAV